MTLDDAVMFIHKITSANYNAQGDTVEWHPAILDAESDVEDDTMELGLRVAWYFYDENYWREGALAHVL